MKVVLFCGGQGMRMRPLLQKGQGAAGESMPKPMIEVAPQQPLLWHVMKYYAHFGHRDFILCLGYRAEMIKEFFLRYNDHLASDFVMENGDISLPEARDDIRNWRITFVDTGLNANIGERLLAVKPYLEGEDMFLANYSDGLSDLPLPEYVRAFEESAKTAACICIHPPQTSHVVRLGSGNAITDIEPITAADIRINGGYFVFRKEIFDYIRPGEELVHEPFKRLIDEDKLFGYAYDGFWMCLDTFKEKQMLDDMISSGDTPWMFWKRSAGQAPA